MSNLTDGGEGGVGYIMLEDQKQKIRKANTENQSHTGKIHITNGTKDILIYKNEIIPEGWVKGRKGGKHDWTIEERQRISNQRKGRVLNLSGVERQNRKERTKGNKSTTGKKWINDGSRSLYIETHIEVPNGWKLGRIKTWLNQFEKLKILQ